MVTGYYVSVIDGSRRSLLLGPFVEHAYARAYVERVRAFAVERVDKAHFYGFGTARVAVPDGEALPQGLLNDKMPWRGDSAEPPETPTASPQRPGARRALREAAATSWRPTPAPRVATA